MFRLALIFVVALAGVSLAAQGREPLRPLAHGMRLKPEGRDEGFLYLFHEPSGLWVGRECQLRVPLARALPEPLAPERQSERLQLHLIGAKSVESLTPSGGMRNEQRFGTWRWWWLSMPVGDIDLPGPQRLGVQLHWPPEANAPAEADTLEIFDLPAIDAAPPEVWSEWRGPDRWRAGKSAWRDELRRSQGADAPKSANPFEIRCRAGLWEVYARRKK
ncbi:hypothetical protein BURK2_00815 [Burkholderiales bacterium]|nr:MAG: hypothetical protein F9K47_11440 [Burkholderiales bacterium]CAG0962482.1 hypothetical protein BURK2_00815 [Burkholderiales bacterium]